MDKNWELLGKTCCDMVSGATGIVDLGLEWLYGCTQYTLTPKINNVSVAEHASRRLFSEGQLEIIDEGLANKVTTPDYEEPKYFGKFVKDRVTGISGMCIGRAVTLFSAEQYIIEFQPEDFSKDARIIWLDEGRVEPLPESDKDIDPADVKSPRNGGVGAPVNISRPGTVNMII